jgi:hypothetical protein
VEFGRRSVEGPLADARGYGTFGINCSPARE